MAKSISAFGSSSVRAAVAAILGTTAVSGFMISTAYAQEADTKEATVEEVTVTGSRILRKDFEAVSPIVTVGSEAFENTSTVALETSLNKLPQFAPSVTQFVTQDVQNTATNTVGASTVNLRGLGSNRNLVLLDGRRAMPVNASMVVDINSVPSAAVERVEIISGGASSVYGADAVGGVVNFILKKNFEGMQFDSQYGITELGDGQEFRVSALMGTNFANGRGNVMFGVEHSDRQDATQTDRDFYLGRMRDPTVGPTEFFYSDTSLATDFNNAPNQAVVNGIFSQAAAGAIPNTTPYYVNKNGTVYTGGAAFGAGEADGAYRYNGILDNQFRKILANGAIGENQQANLVSIPMQRWSMFGSAHFDISDSVTFFAQGNFNKNRVQSVLQYSPGSNGWGAMIPHGSGIYAPSVDASGNTLAAFQAGGLYGLNCGPVGGCTNSQAFPVSPEVGQLLDSRPNADASWQLNRVLDFMGPRGSVDESTTYQIIGGLQGELPGNDWTWEAFASHGETTVQINLTGIASLERYRAIVSAPNYGVNYFQTGNQGLPGNGFAAATGICTSGLPIFGDAPVSQDCLDAIGANLQNNTRMQQDIVEANIQGGLFDLPAGQLRFALGTSYRENTFSYQTDILTSQESFLDGGIGLFPAGNSSGRTDVKEVYGELLVPVLSQLPAFKRLDLELGYRFSDYNTVGGVSTYKGMVDWVVNDYVRFRGGHQLAVRAPNIGELFLARTQAIGSSSFGDYCSTAGTAPNGANPAKNPNAAQAEALCRQLMGPAGAAVYYAQTQPTGGPGIAIANTVGNPNLDPEEARTYTAGFVLRSPFESDLLNRITASIDWYSIDIKDAIGATSVDSVFDSCLGAAFNPTFDPNTPACQAIVRDPSNGGPGATNTSYTNQGRIKTSGVDMQLDWAAALTDMGMKSLPGTFSVNFLFNWVDSFKTQANPQARTIEWVGTLGPDTPGLNPQGGGGVFDWKAYTTLNYVNGPAGVSLRWRHLPKIDSLPSASDPASTVEGAASYDIFDLSGTWQINSALMMRFGVDNLLDKQPPVLARNPAVVMSGGQFDTNTGYYDVLGRRYYLGVKLQF